MEPKTICDMWKQWFFKETDRINRRKVMQTAFMLQGFFIVMAQLLSLSAFNGVCGWKWFPVQACWRQSHVNMLLTEEFSRMQGQCLRPPIWSHKESNNRESILLWFIGNINTIHMCEHKFPKITKDVPPVYFPPQFHTFSFIYEDLLKKCISRKEWKQLLTDFFLVFDRLQPPSFEPSAWLISPWPCTCQQREVSSSRQNVNTLHAGVRREDRRCVFFHPPFCFLIPSSFTLMIKSLLKWGKASVRWNCLNLTVCYFDFTSTESFHFSKPLLLIFFL